MEDIENTIIPFETVRIPYSDKAVGEEIIVQDGVDGVRIITRVDGQIVTDKTTHPKNKLIYVGTKEVENVSTPVPPQEEVKKHTPQNIETYKDSFVPPITGYSNQPQGRFSEDGGNKETTVNSETLKKALLEAARLLVFALPGILIAVFTGNPELGGSLGATILLVLKSIDRGIHENQATASQGILPF